MDDSAPSYPSLQWEQAAKECVLSGNGDMQKGAHLDPEFCRLVDLLSDGTAYNQEAAAWNIFDMINSNPCYQRVLAVARAISPLVLLLSTGNLASVPERAAEALAGLAASNPDSHGKVAAAGAIPP